MPRFPIAGLGFSGDDDDDNGGDAVWGGGEK